MIDPTTEFGARVAKRLKEEQVIWFTTISSDGTPQPNPVWFCWDGETFLIYSQPTSRKLANITRNSKASVNLQAGELGDDVVVFTGDAFIDDAAAQSASKPNSKFLEKYCDAATKWGRTIEGLAASYSVAIRMKPKKVRGF